MADTSRASRVVSPLEGEKLKVEHFASI